MRRLVAALALALCPAAAAEEPPFLHVHLAKVRALEARVLREVVRVEVRRPAAAAPGQWLRFDGAGIHVGQGRVLTAAFYLKDASAIRVVLPDGTHAPARLVREALPLGLSLVEAPAARALPVPEIAADHAQRRGDALYLLQNPASPNARLTLGVLVEPGAGGFYARATFVARNGHPIYDEHGRVAGVGALPAKEAAISLFVPAWAIRKFLAEEKDREPARGAER